ncbi:MAG: hypothetical protein WKF37_24590 [Bryobacteraceae bacterium]
MKTGVWKNRAPAHRDGFTLWRCLFRWLSRAARHLLSEVIIRPGRTGSRHIDTDAQARLVLDRIATDVGKMFMRTDVDYYVKAPVGYKNPNAHGNGKKLVTGQQGNDQIAFFSHVPGYYASGAAQSPISLVAYRINNNDPSSESYLRLERMGKGLLWNGADTTNQPPTNVNFTSPIVFLPLLINDRWPAATDSSTYNADYQTLGSQVFRLEYYYLLKDGSVTDVPATAWDLSKSASANLKAFRDVEAIAFAIAVMDPASRTILYDASKPADPWHCLFSMGSDMADFKNANGNGNAAQKIGDLEKQWNTRLQSASATGKTSDGNSFPPAAASGIRVYNRYVDLKTL